MEKKKVKRALKIILFIYVAILLLLFLLQLWFIMHQLSLSLESLLYWLVLFGWVYAVVVYKKSSGVSLKVALSIFVIGAVLNLFNLFDISETFMKFSFIGWIIGLGQAVTEYMRVRML